MTLHATEQARPDVVAARETFRAEIAAVSAADLVFLDESGVTTTLVRRYARAAGGARAVGHVPAGHWTQLTILGALSLTGLGACMTVNAPTDTDVFTAYVRHLLVPTLRPGQVVVLDNLSAHRAAAVRTLIEGAGCRLLFLPPYSPDFKPIEPAWSKLKTLLRGAAARTRDVLEAALKTFLDYITASDAQGWFAHAGYPTAE
jgi:transposase